MNDETGAAPLAGRRVLVTRGRTQAGSLAEGLRRLGAVVLEAPAIEIAPPEDVGPLDRALARLADYDWLVLTSANAVRAVRDRLAAASLAGGPQVATVGAATRAAFEAAFARGVDLQPATDFRAEGLVEAFRGVSLAGRRVLVPGSHRARDLLPRLLGERGARVDVVVAYRTLAPADLAARLAEMFAGGIDLATFTSSSSVESFVAAAGDRARRLPAAVIGPVTESTARAAGLDVRVVASPSTVDGLLAAVAAHFAGPDACRP